MKTRIESSNNSSQNKVLRETDIGNNKEVLRKFRKLRKTSASLEENQTSASSPIKSIQPYAKLKEKVELNVGLRNLTFRETLFLWLNTLLRGNDEIFSQDLPIIQGDIVLQPFSLSKGKSVDLQLSFSEPGIKIISAETVNGEDGLVQVDPLLTIWKRPSEVIRTVDNIGPNSLNANLVFIIEDKDDLFNYVAQISAISSSQSGNFTLTVLSVSPIDIFTETPVLLDLARPGGRNGRSARLKEGECYLIFAYSNTSSFEDLLNTAIYVRSPEGVVLATNFGTSSIDFSARILFQAAETGEHLFELDAVENDGDDSVEEATCISIFFILCLVFYSVVSPAAVDLSTLSEIRGDILSAMSQTYFVSFEEDLEYEISLDSFFLDEFTQLIDRTLLEENVDIRLPRFPPSLTLRIEDPTTSELLIQEETRFDYEFSLDGNVVEMNPVNISGVSFIFASNLGSPLLLEVFPTNPEYYTENFHQAIGSFNITFSSRSIQSSLDSVELVDPNDPYRECYQNPFELLAAGCSSGVYLYCRNNVDPFSNIYESTIDQALDICICVIYMCQELPGSETGGDQISGLLLFLDIFILIVATIFLSTLCYLIYEYKMYTKDDSIGWKIPHKVSWILSILFFINILFYSSTGIALGNFFSDLNDMSNAYVSQEEGIFQDDDYLFYANNPFDAVFDYLDGIRNSEDDTTIASSATPFLNEDAQNIFDNIRIDFEVVGDIFAYSQAILESLAMISFIEISIAWVYVTFSASAVLRQKSEKQKRRVVFYIRIFQFSVGLTMLWYTFARFISRGKIYSNLFFYLYALTAALVGFLLFYVILLFRRAALPGIEYETASRIPSKLSYSTKRKTLQDIIRPIENAALTLICCVSGITISNIYFGINYSSKVDRLRARTQNLSKSFEIFNDVCLLGGMICIFVYLVWSNREAKQLQVEDEVSSEFQTGEVGQSSYQPKLSAKETSRHMRNSEKQVLSGFSLPSAAGNSIYYRFGFSTVIDTVKSQQKKSTVTTIRESQAHESNKASKKSKVNISENKVSTVADSL
eukprot:snap_masked-scaffold_33-processed-gene-2.31-mRNA-1 protein AED:1.00 eAED:1.00 QI:0/0/0/0/1/1/11/0/1042